MKRIDRRRGVMAGAAVLVTVAVIATAVALPRSDREPASSGPSPFGAAASPGTGPATGPVTGPGASPGASAEGWSDLTLAAFEPPATLEPTAADGRSVAVDTAFVLHSTDGSPAVELAGRLRTSPPVALVVQAGATPDQAFVRPAVGLTAGATYRFTLPGDGGTTAASWAFQAAAPLHVVGTLPDDKTSGVPVDTGIEIAFDQDGVVDAADHFAIEPRVEGRFETHGRTLVFIPNALKRGTTYTISLSRGVRLQGSNQTLEKDVSFAFETENASAPREEERVAAQRVVIEAALGRAPALGLSMYFPDEDADHPSPRPETLPVRIHRIASTDAAEAAIRTLAEGPVWAEWSAAGLVATDGLHQVASFDARLQQLGTSGDEGYGLSLPDNLDAGWYVVTIPRTARDVQAILQVTNLAAYALATTTDTIVWVHDLATGSPLGGATIRSGSATLGRTDADGLSRFRTPHALREPRQPSSDLPSPPRPILRVTQRDRTVLVPLLSVPSNVVEKGEFDRIAIDDPTDRLWLLFSTDRTLYRTRDQVNAWGVVRARDGGLPASLELRLLRSDDNDSATRGAPPIVVVSATPDAAGAFAAAIPLDDVPLGGYRIELWADGVHVADQWVGVALIRKPAYELGLESDRRILIAGDDVVVTATARFFDGTPVGGVELVAGAFETEQRATTDAQGRASFRFAARMSSPDQEDLDYGSVNVSPARAEEGEIGAGLSLLVFPSSRHITGTGIFRGEGARFAGTLTEVDINRLERDPGTFTEEINPAGRPIAGATITVNLVERDWVRKVTGRRYDFITKRSEEIVEYDLVEHQLGSQRIQTDDEGRFRLDLPTVRAGRDYVAMLATEDAASRSERATLFAEHPGTRREDLTVRPYLGSPAGCGVNATEAYATGAKIDLTMRTGAGPLPVGEAGSYLFITAQRGLRDVRIAASPRLVRTFSAADVPNVSLGAVWFTGTGYAPSTGVYAATFDPGERNLKVQLSTDKARYQPGGSATLTVRTTDRDGRPAPATVVLRAIDEKLYALGAVQDVDLMGELYRPVGDGLLRSYGSHAPLMPRVEDGCGDTGGGGRDDFRDSLLFRRITTDATGRATVVVPLSEDLTSWRISAAAIDGDLRAGRGDVSIPVGLPFFVEATVAPEYLVADRPAIRLRAFGSSLRKGEAVAFTVSSDTLPLAAKRFTGRAFEALDVPLPALSAGRHKLTIKATTGTGTGALADTLIRTFAVVPSRLAGTQVVSWTLGEEPPALGDAGGALTTYAFSDAGRGRLLPTLERIAGSDGPRVDQALAAALARDLLIARFGHSASDLPEVSFDPGRYQRDSGVALLPYASADLDLTARVAGLGGGRFEVSSLARALHEVVDDPATTRERRIVALAGLASIGDPVLPQLRLASVDAGLTDRERLHVALGAVALGDDDTARAIERELLERHGERFGSLVRLRIDEGPEATAEATALLAVLAASLGDPLAFDAAAYLEANPALDDLHDLHLVAVAGRMIDRLPGEAARFAYAIDGKRTAITLGPGEAFALTLSAGQSASLVLEPVQGRVAVTVARRVALDSPPPLKGQGGLVLTRSIDPAGQIGDDRLVQVTLRIQLPTQPPAGCFAVTDHVPSGLAPLAGPAGWRDEETPEPNVVGPDSVEGQIVRFCVGRPDRGNRAPVMRYVARVVTTGSYRWEPAVVQPAAATEILAGTAAKTIHVAAR